MTESLEIQPCGPVVGTIQPPGSKSITNRALICSALAGGKSKLQGVLDSVDTRVMVKGLQSLGIPIEAVWERNELVIEGQGGSIPGGNVPGGNVPGGNVPGGNVTLDLENSGTSIRFLTAFSCLGTGAVALTGNPRMQQRPIQDLLDALQAMGANPQSRLGNGCPPVEIDSRDPSVPGLTGGQVSIRGDVSSQYLSAIMMVAPYASADVKIQVSGELVSRPYVEMTAKVMESFGVLIPRFEQQEIEILTGQGYRAIDYMIEPDASAASYFWAAAAITGGDVTVQGLSKKALQGDVRFCECLAQMGCEVEYLVDAIRVRGNAKHGIDVDMGDISDTVQTLAAVSLFVDGPTTVRGVAHNRHKETDRIGDLACELRKLGATVDEFEDGMKIIPRQLQGAEIETYDDHRMAMSLSLVGLQVPGVKILNPACTSKTYPKFFEDLTQLAYRSPQT